jgi:hypothetical protein
MHAIRMMLSGKHPIHGLPFDGEVPNRLRQEWTAMSRRARFQRVRKALQRDLLVLATGQAGRCVDRAPPGVLKVLWIYNWTTLGDSIMDLSARFSVPAQIELDLCIAPALAALYAADTRFAHVFGRLDDAARHYDFIMIHELTGRVMRQKRRRWRAVPFAAVLNSFIGELVARPAFVDARLRHLFGQPRHAAPSPRLALGDPAAPSGDCFDVAVVLGSGDRRRGFPHWNDALHRVLAGWPAHLPRLRFRLLGSDNAMAELATLSDTIRQSHGEDLVGRTSLLEAAHTIRDCDAFLGPDGGLMHIAVAAGKPGLALFAGIDPSLRLPEATSLRSLFAPRALADLEVQAVADAFIAACTANRGGDLRRGRGSEA